MGNDGATLMRTTPLTPESAELIEELFKTAQLGGCINGVAHDLNNYLGAILAYAELVALEPNLGPDAKRMLGEIMGAVRKSTNLLGTLTSIARRDKDAASLVEISQTVDRTVELCRYEFKANHVAIDSDVPVQVASLLVDEPKIIRALLYLFRNAMEQALEHEPHRIRVGVRADVEGVDITVSNPGPGVPESEREVIFEPFYTKKRAPHLGLGLTHARNIARRHGGDVTYQEGRGFVLRLPRVTALETA